MALRDALRKPWVGSSVVVVILLLAAYLYLRNSGAGSPESPERLAQKIAVRDSVTGEEWEITRAKMISGLRSASAQGRLDPNHGLINPKTKKPTGFPVDREEWEATIARLNEEREAYNKARGLAKPGT